MAKKLDLTKMRAGQTVYFVDTDIHKRRDWQYSVRKLMVNNAPIPHESVDCFYGEMVSRHALKDAVDNGVINRRGGRVFFTTRNAAERECDRGNSQINRIRNLAAKKIDKKVQEQIRNVLYTGSI